LITGLKPGVNERQDFQTFEAKQSAPAYAMSGQKDEALKTIDQMEAPI
jgi:hypothetical protein